MIVVSGGSKVILDEGDEARLIVLNEALSNSKAKGKSTYTTSSITYGVGRGEERGGARGHVLLSGPEDGIHPYVFPLAIKLAKGERLALVPIFLGSLFYRLDECVQN